MKNNLYTIKGAIIWLTGRPAAGKTTLCMNIKNELEQKNMKVYQIDGEVIRKGLNSDLGFSKEDRRENVRRIAEVACMFCKLGYYVIVCTVSPFEEMRTLCRNICRQFPYMEIYIKAELPTCIKRDYKNVYNKENLLVDYYEKNKDAELIIDTERLSVDQCKIKILESITKIL